MWTNKMSSRTDAWRSRWIGWRNRLLGSARMRRAAAMPPARPIARRYAADLFDLTAGFVYSQVTAAMVESGLLEALRLGPLSGDDAAACAGLPADAAATLLKAAASLGLAQQVGAWWHLGERGAALLATPGLSAMIAHHRLLYADLADPLAMLRGQGDGQLASLWRYDGSADPRDVAHYSTLMAASQPLVAEQALAAYSFGRHRRILDVGGGEGAFIQVLASVAPDSRFGLMDVPPVIERARVRLAGLIDRVTLHPGSFLSDPLPGGYDLATLVRVLHDHDDQPAAHLLASIRAALAQGGRLLIVEPMAERNAHPPGHAYFGFYLAAMRSGRPRTPKEIKAMLAEAGFVRSRLLATPLPLVARVIQADIK
jgi:demethylspheroidene O-methyltransferase